MATTSLPQRDDTGDQLNILLCDELSAIMSYDAALQRMASPAHLELGENRESHKRRSILLADAITAHGRISDTGLSVWGVFGRTDAPADRLIDRREAIDALLAGEDRMLADYQAAQRLVDSAHRQLLITDLMPDQELTHGRIKLLWMSGTPPSAP